MPWRIVTISQSLQTARALRNDTAMNGASDLELQRWSRGLRGAPVLWVSVGSVALLALVLWLRGASFYELPLSQRIDHADYQELSPSRRTGMVYGVVGLALMFLNLGYLLRRRFPHWPLGRMRLWLDSHVLSGLIASLFVAFHSAFQVRSAAATVTSATLAITVVTGLVGRFFYALVPRTESALIARITDLDALIPGVAATLTAGIAQLVPARPSGSGLWRVARMLPSWWRTTRARRAWVIAQSASRLESANLLERQYAEPLTREVAQLAAREVYAIAGQELLRAWRPWHRLCALIMVTGILLHAGVALFYGYGWNIAR